jgi:transcriptional regulator with XRE-family HTH domain
MTPVEYKAARELRGSQVAVAAKLGVAQNTVSRREIGEIPITQEAAIALLAIPKPRKPRGGKQRK